MADIFQNEEYCEVHRQYGLKHQEYKMKKYLFDRGEGTAEEVEALRKEVEQLKKEKAKVYSKVFYHQRIKTNRVKKERRRLNEAVYRAVKREEKQREKEEAERSRILFENDEIIVYKKN